MPQPSMPPVPQGLRDMLKDYPEQIQTLQDDLNRYVQKPFHLMPFDGAIWLLEGALEAFISEAREELKAAEATGNQEAIALKKMKKFTMGSARADMGDLSDLRAFLQDWTQS
jgi:hypothetical protein